MHEYAITVMGTDRPGIVADVSAVLAGAGLNLTDSTMTLLRGHFAMTLICAGSVPVTEVEAALDPIALAGPLVVAVREVTAQDGAPLPGRPHILRLHGADRLGIVAAVTRALASAGGNVTDLTTRLTGGLYVLIAEADLPTTVDIDGLAAKLREVGAGLGVEVTLSPAEPDLL